MAPTTGWFPRTKLDWLLFLGTLLGVLFIHNCFFALVPTLILLYAASKKSTQRGAEAFQLLKPIVLASVIGIALIMPLPFFFTFTLSAAIFAAAKTTKLLSKAPPQFQEAFSNVGYIRFACLLIVLAGVGVVVNLFGFNRWYYPFDFLQHQTVSLALAELTAGLIVFPVVLWLSVSLRKFLSKVSSVRPNNRFFGNIWQDLTFYGFFAAHILFIATVFFMPGGPGQWLSDWLLSCARDANLVWYAVPTSSAIWVLDMEQVVAVESFDFRVCVKLILTALCSIVLAPHIVSNAAFLTSFARRLRVASLQSCVEDFLEVLRSPSQKLAIREAIPWLHHASITFFWLLLCYLILFSLVAFCPGPLGAAIVQWLDFSIADAGFQPHALQQFPQLRIFAASLVAMIGLVPLAVTGCVFLPAMKPKCIVLGADGFLLPQGPYLSLFMRPLRSWSDIRSIEVRGRVGEQRLSKRWLRISFFSTGYLKLRLDQLSRKDLYDLLSAIDEHADNCLISEDVIELRRELADTERSSDLPEEGQLRNLPASNFRSTTFVPFEVGEKIPGKNLRIVRQLSAKQLSAVYVVRCSDGQLAVAKQFSFPSDSPQTERLRKNFLREYELLSRLNHARVAKVLDVFEHENSSILLLQYARGRDLRDLVEQDGPRNQRVVIDIALQLCDVLGYLHQQDPPILHRDLTPDNLVFDEDKQVQLIDFGAAHQFLEGVTGTLIGKQCYVAPEQLRGEPTTRSDIYSFGCSIYFLLTGNDPVALSQCDPSDHAKISPELNRLVMDCTAFDENERPESFQIVRERLVTIAAETTGGAERGAWIKLKTAEKCHG